MVTVPLTGDGPYDVRAVPNLSEVVADLEAHRLGAVAIDIPIGLPESGSRLADVEARRRVGPRRNSVFPAPARAVLGAATYAEACARSRQVSGKAISKQLFNILEKIAEVDALVTPPLQERLVEMFPEWSLAVLAGTPMSHPKSKPAGRAERTAALGGSFGHEALAAHLRPLPPGAKVDDVLDAFAGAWTARRLAVGVPCASAVRSTRAASAWRSWPESPQVRWAATVLLVARGNDQNEKWWRRGRQRVEPQALGLRSQSDQVRLRKSRNSETRMIRSMPRGSSGTCCRWGSTTRWGSVSSYSRPRVTRRTAR